MPSDDTTTHTRPASAAPDTDRRTRDESLTSLEAGLDALQTDVHARTGRGRRALRALLPLTISVSLLLLVWEVAFRLGPQDVTRFPPPALVGLTFLRLWDDQTVVTALTTSVERGVVGFLLAALIGTPLGIVVARVRWVRASFGPLITGLQVLPSVAWVPAAVIWFGLSDATVYAVILLGAVPSIINGIVAGVDQVPPLFRRVGLVLGANPVELVRHVILPAALPGYLAGLKQGWAFSWRSLMAAELITVGGDIGFGLGQLLQQGRDLGDMSRIFVGIILVLVVGIAVELLVFAPVERAVMRRRGLATA
ncbi:ABC transporter permease [Sanguibacter suaedae]|uniref:ABC transporter permease n=1 Tax=Sanguibacter suaedae TaxID=2795737 RepID=A0A934MAE0_9MICO|nr:ABC transporter permease [Sanguibacter suaedae]MBI9114131.1 ABC transporter permease [Sanguibacter suaedae]